ncbi:hypothetical protein AAFF_G00414320 [Aldrovandia affinis]|uniref:Uncharacterized protein n=1 Tax=Aldrovandia affinis TaxID=143900 RepID=A0AAD7SAY4_9TELE|nr:hypothetical protein AAFF_G00414320 [Aldrovandia affinis]
MPVVDVVTSRKDQSHALSFAYGRFAQISAGVKRERSSTDPIENPAGPSHLLFTLVTGQALGPWRSDRISELLLLSHSCHSELERIPDYSPV